MVGHTSGEEQQRQAEIEVAKSAFFWTAFLFPPSHPVNTQRQTIAHLPHRTAKRRRKARILSILFECRTYKFGHFVCGVALNYPCPLPIEPGLDMVINRVAAKVRSLFHTSQIAQDHRTGYATQRIQVSG